MSKQASVRVNKLVTKWMNECDDTHIIMNQWALINQAWHTSCYMLHEQVQALQEIDVDIKM